MKKQFFQDEFNKIEVPESDVLKAIQTGVKRANTGTITPKRKTRMIALSSVAAATIVLSSSFLSPTLSKALADVPVVGTFYGNFNDLIGRNLELQTLITEINETSSNKNVDVTITSAYYDGAVIGVTFKVKGNVKAEEDGRVSGMYEIFDGDGAISDSRELTYMEVSEDGYTGHIQLHYPKTSLPEETTFPLEFKRIGEKEGSWRFDVPITQLAYETINVGQESTNIEADVSLQIDSIIAGNASTSIDYTATLPSEGKHDQIRLEVYDDQGEQLHLLSDGIDLETSKEGNRMIVKGRSIIPEALQGKTEYLDIQPKVAIQEPKQFAQLNTETPVNLASARQNLAVNIEDILVEDNSVTVDFQVNNGEKGNWDTMFFHDFAKNDVLLVKETEKEINQKPLKHSVTALDKEALRFRSTFELPNNFTLEDYVLSVNMNSLSMNIPAPLEKVRVTLE